MSDEWTIEVAPTTGDLTFKQSGFSAMKVDGNGNLFVCGNISSYSDARIKTDIRPISDALERVSALHGCTYMRTDLQNTSRRCTGLLAQDVQRVMPEAVEEGDPSSISYGALSGLFVEAIKELGRGLPRAGTVVRDPASAFSSAMAFAARTAASVVVVEYSLDALECTGVAAVRATLELPVGVGAARPRWGAVRIFDCGGGDLTPFDLNANACEIVEGGLPAAAAGWSVTEVAVRA